MLAFDSNVSTWFWRFCTVLLRSGLWLRMNVLQDMVGELTVDGCALLAAAA